MKRYVYHKKTKEFVKEITPQANPVREGEYLFPPNSTEVVPPVLKERETAVFNGVYWIVVPDYRGELKIDLTTRETQIVSDIGDLSEGEMLYSDYLLSDEYIIYQAEQEKEKRISELLEAIKSVDEKRIRAVCEPSIKDEVTGQTWLEFYNSQIVSLREQLSEVGYVA